jgi:hypothetical protein
MPSLRNEAVRNALILRLDQLTPTTKPRWGKFDAPRMICHLGDTLAMALGEIHPPSVKANAVQRFLLKYLFLYVLPMPKGLPTASELLSSPPENFAADRQRVVEEIGRLAKAPRAMGPEHPFFGPLSNEEWNRLQCKHTDHHLKQFGV